MVNSTVSIHRTGSQTEDVE